MERDQTVESRNLAFSRSNNSRGNPLLTCALYPKKLEGSVVSSRVSGTHDRHPHPADQSRVIKP